VPVIGQARAFFTPASWSNVDDDVANVLVMGAARSSSMRPSRGKAGLGETRPAAYKRCPDRIDMYVWNWPPVEEMEMAGANRCVFYLWRALSSTAQGIDAAEGGSVGVGREKRKIESDAANHRPEELSLSDSTSDTQVLSDLIGCRIKSSTRKSMRQQKLSLVEVGGKKRRM
jgi:hypothetical protein